MYEMRLVAYRTVPAASPAFLYVPGILSAYWLEKSASCFWSWALARPVGEPADLEDEFDSVGDLLVSLEERIREDLMPGPDLLQIADPLTHLLGSWSLERARDATSPATWPPIPSATTNSPTSGRVE